jgi:hypothetical protein
MAGEHVVAARRVEDDEIVVLREIGDEGVERSVLSRR